jgi:hypothetical protein
LRLALAITKQAWFDVNVQTGEALTSPEYAKLLGYDPSDFKSDLQGWQDSLHPTDHETVTAAFLKCLSQGSEFSMEYRRRKKMEVGSGSIKRLKFQNGVRHNNR